MWMPHPSLDEPPPPRAVGIRLSLVLVGLVLLVGVCIGLYLYAMPYLSLGPVRQAAQSWATHDRPAWMRQPIAYAPEAPPEPNHQPPPRDLTQEQLALLRQELALSQHFRYEPQSRRNPLMIKELQRDDFP